MSGFNLNDYLIEEIDKKDAYFVKHEDVCTSAKNKSIAFKNTKFYVYTCKFGFIVSLMEPGVNKTYRTYLNGEYIING